MVKERKIGILVLDGTTFNFHVKSKEIKLKIEMNQYKFEPIETYCKTFR